MWWRPVLVIAIAACGSAAPRTTTPVAVPTVVLPEPPALRLPRDLEPRGYTVALAFTQARFTGTVAIDGTLTSAATVVWLHAARLDIASARALQGGRSVELTASPVPARELLALVPRQPLAAGAVTIEITYHGTAGMDGLVEARDHGDRYLMTHFTPMSARRVFPCIDEPDRKVPWQLTLDVEPADSVLANVAIARETMIGGKKRVELAPTMPLPSYLVAFAIGPYEIVDAGRTSGGAPIRIATLRGQRAAAAFGAARTVMLVELVERLVGVPLPYGKLDFVAVPPVPWRTTAQPGLVAFDAGLLRGGWIAASLDAIARQWFGGSVTPRWWDDVWLAEGWAAYVADKATGMLGPAAIEPPFERDEGTATATRVRATGDAVRDAKTLAPFLTGGASRPVIDWLERYAGEPAVRALLRDYVEKYADRVAAAEDLIELVAEGDLRTTLGVRVDASEARDPVIETSVICDGKHAVIRLAIAKPQIWSAAPACVAYEQRGARVDTCVLLSPSATVYLEACPVWAVANERTPSVEAMSSPQTLFDKAWPQLHDSERARALERATGELALRMAERMFAQDATREIAAWHLLELERYVPEPARAAFATKVRAMTGARVKAALGQRHGVLANAQTVSLAAIAGDPDARAAVVKLVPDPVRVHPALFFALRLAVRFDPAVAARVLELVPARPSYAHVLRASPEIVRLVGETPAKLDGETRLDLLSSSCSQTAVDEISRTSHREAAAIERVRRCMRTRDLLAPAFTAWLGATTSKR